MRNISIFLNKKRILITYIVICILFVIHIIYFSLKLSINLPTNHIDGAFQTASALFRLGNGENFGKDFLPYLGIGTNLIIYPFFKIAGGNLFASVFASQFVTLIIKWVIISFICHLIFKSKNYINSLFWGVVFYFLLTQISLAIPYISLLKFSFLNSNRFYSDPGNSLRPLRAAIPYLTSIGTFSLIVPRKNWKLSVIIGGLFIGLSMQWSNDYALPTSIALFIFYIVFFNFKYKISWLKSIVLITLSSFLSWILIISFFTAGHPLEIIKYNFFDIAKDQWWYFAPYEERYRIFEILQINKIFSIEICFALSILIFTFFKVLQKKSIEYFFLLFLGLISLGGGILSSLGGHIGLYYFESFNFWAATTAILALLRFSQIYVTKILLKNETLLSILRNIFLILMFSICAFKVLNERQNYFNLFISNKKDNNKIFVKELGGFLGDEWKSYIDYIKLNKNSKILEDYWGLFSSINRKSSSIPVDSIIHALGGVRNLAKSEIEKNDLIVTTRYSFSELWQPWGVSQNFWFYEELFSSWKQEFLSPNTIVWRKLKKPRDLEFIECVVSSDKTSFYLKTNKKGYYFVDLNYKITGNRFKRNLVLLRNNFSYPYSKYSKNPNTAGFVSLPPISSSIKVPLLILDDSNTNFYSKIFGNDDTKFVIESCIAKNIKIDNENVLPFNFDH